jgi:hypothetical protein
MQDTLRILFIALQLALAFFVGPIQAADDPRNIAGYDKAVWGMSEDEMLKAESPRAEKVDKPFMSQEGIDSVTIKEIEIGPHKFHATFTFDHKSQKLVRVYLTSDQKGPFIASLIFSSIEELLTEKYGAPTYKQESKNASWKLPKTVIDLRYIPIIGLVIVVYRPVEASADASKDL